MATTRTSKSKYSNWPNISVDMEGQEGTNRSLSYNARTGCFMTWDNLNTDIESGDKLTENDIHKLADMFLTMSIHIKMHNGVLETLNTEI